MQAGSRPGDDVALNIFPHANQQRMKNKAPQRHRRRPGAAQAAAEEDDAICEVPRRNA